MKVCHRPCAVYGDDTILAHRYPNTWPVFLYALFHPRLHGICDPFLGLAFVSTSRSVSYEIMESETVMDRAEFSALRVGPVWRLYHRHLIARFRYYCLGFSLR